jgi:hypothetical protein
MTLFERVHLPSFAGATGWLNSEPLGRAGLRGRVVLVSFWTWTYINWLRHRSHARDAHLVLSRGARQPIPFRVLLDGEPPGPSHGVDVDDEGNGVLRDDRLYQLVRQHDAVRQRTAEMTFLEPGAEAYAFTFG